MKMADFSTPKRTYVPDFIDLVHATIGGIEHDEFKVKVRFDDNHQKVSIYITSENRHHTVPATGLEGSETMAHILELAST